MKYYAFKFHSSDLENKVIDFLKKHNIFIRKIPIKEIAINTSLSQLDYFINRYIDCVFIETTQFIDYSENGVGKEFFSMFKDRTDTFQRSSDIEDYLEGCFNLREIIHKNPEIDLCISMEDIYSTSIPCGDEKARIKTAFDNINIDYSLISELIIIDPYLLTNPKEKDRGKENYTLHLFYCVNLFPKLKDLKIITSKSKTNKKVKNLFKQRLEKNNISMNVKYNEELHDRYWICDRHIGIRVGTSFNGISKKKLFSINSLSKEDLNKILRVIGNQI